MTLPSPKKAPKVEKFHGSVALMTSSENGHSHSVRLFVEDVAGGNMAGETSYSAGSTEDGANHAHPFTLDLETGELRIGDALDHSHEVEADELGEALASLTQQLAESPTDSDSEFLLRSDNVGPGARVARRQLSDAVIPFVSLCRRGMNGIQTLMKSDGRFSISSTLSKMTKEGLLHTLVWVPDLPCHEGDVMTAEEIRKMAHGFLPNGGHIDIEHNGKPLADSQVSVAEHYIVSKGDPKFSGIRSSEGAEVDPTGAWGLILKIHDPEIRADYETGKWNGVSMAGKALAKPVSKTGDPDPEPQTPENSDMTPEEQKAFAQEVATQIKDGLTEVFKSVAPAPVQTVDPEPDTKATIQVPDDLDMNDPEALEQWQDELYISTLDATDPKDIAKRITFLNKRKEEAELRKQAEADAEAQAKKEADEKAAAESGEGEGAPEGESELQKAQRELTEQKARVEKLEKASKQPADAGSDNEDSQDGVVGLEKGEKDQWKLGRDLAKRMQGAV